MSYFYSSRPQPIEAHPFEVQAAMFRERMTHAQARAGYWQRRYAEQERRANYFERQHNKIAAQLATHQETTAP